MFLSTFASYRESSCRRHTHWLTLGHGDMGHPRPSTVKKNGGQLRSVDTLAAWLGAGKAAHPERSGSRTPTRPRPRRQSCASDPTRSANGFSDDSGTGVDSRRRNCIRKPDKRTSVPSIVLHRADLVGRNFLAVRNPIGPTPVPQCTALAENPSIGWQHEIQGFP